MPLDLGTLRVGFAFTAGAATFFAPCAFPLLPGYVAFYLGHGDGEPPMGVTSQLTQAVMVGLVTSIGFFLVYGVLGGIVMAFGTRVLRNVSILELVVGGLMILLGVAMAAGKLDPKGLHVRLPERRRSPTGFLAFGISYAAAAAGCTAPVFVAVAAFALSSGPVAAFVTLGAYAAGMSVLMVAVTVASALGRDQVLGSLASNSGRIARLSGVLLVLAGLAQIYLFLFEFDGLRVLGLM